jgi:hypothetical protein
MIVQLGAVRRPLASGAARRIIGRCALAALGAGLGAISISPCGADLANKCLIDPGRPEAVEIESRSIPAPQAGEVLIRIKALALNRPELFGTLSKSFADLALAIEGRFARSLGTAPARRPA